MSELIRDDFNRPDGVGLGSAWNIFGILGGSIDTYRSSAVGVVAGGGTSFAIARSVEPLDAVEQWGRIAFVVTSTPAIARIGFHSANFGGIEVMGFAVEVVFDSATAARVKIIGATRATALAISPGEVVQVQVAPLLVNGTCIDVVQELRAELRRSASGLELLAWFNDQDDDRPVLRWRFIEDEVPGGRPYFAIWNSNATNSARVGEVQFATTRDLSARTADTRVPEDRPTLGELRLMVNEAFERHVHRPVRDPLMIDRALNFAQEDLLSQLGDLAGFLRVIEDLSVELDTRKEARLPRRVGRVLKVWLQNQAYTSKPLDFVVIGHDPNGQPLIHVPDGRPDLRVLYEPMIEPMVADHDRSMIPRHFREVLVSGAVLRLFRDGANLKEYGLWEKVHDRLVLGMRVRLGHEQRSRMQPLEVRTDTIGFENPYGT